MFETHPAAGEAEWETDDEPDAKNDKHSREGDGAAGTLDPKEEVQEKEGRKDDAGD